MEANSFLLNAETIRAGLLKVANELSPSNEQQTLLLVGGAVLSLTGLRELTEDIDAISILNEEMKQAIAKVAASMNFQSKWLNNASRAFAPEDEFLGEWVRQIIDRASR